jgi:polysaccharide pyruvyl transferase WcaK-like protein
MRWKALRTDIAIIGGGRYSPRQILSLMNHFEFAVGMRLHFLIFAALRGTPFAALSYSSKVIGLLEDLEMPTPPLGSQPALRERARQTNELLMRLVDERRTGQAAGVDPSGAARPH